MNDCPGPAQAEVSCLDRAWRALRILAIGGAALLFTTSAQAAAPSQLEFRELNGHRAASLPVARPGRTGFTRLPPAQTGIQFTNVLAESRSLTNHILLNGSGVAAGDVDGDGWCDLFFNGLGGGGKLYRNLGGWKFEDITARSGLELRALDGTGATLADIDGDGDPDLLISAVRGGVHLYVNNGSGHFEETTGPAGLASRAGSMTLALADIDGNGSLDLYVSNYRNETLRDGFRMQLRVSNVGGQRVVTMVNGMPLVGPELAGWVTLDEQGNIKENGQADVLYVNRGDGTFARKSFTDGTFLDEEGRSLRQPLFDWTLTAMFRDIDGDGWPDLYACSDLDSPDRIWINQRDGRFRALRSTALRKISWFSMGVDFGDLNRDGWDDFIVTDMLSRDHRWRQVQVSDHKMQVLPVGAITNRPQAPRNTVFINQGDGDYAETAYYCGLHASEWSWSPVLLDVDLDGYEDVLISTGFERDVQDVDIANALEAARRSQGLPDAEALRMRAQFPRLDLPNLVFRNRRDLTFEETGKSWGFDTVGVGQGMALADLDNDGDLDVLVNTMNGSAGIYRNETAAPRLAVRLRGVPPNTFGVGARIRVTGGAVPLQTQELQVGGRYLSSDAPLRSFAAGTPTNRLSVEVLWRSGKRSRVENLQPDQLVEINEPAGDGIKEPLGETTRPQEAWFTDASPLLGHRHMDDFFEDLVRQPLLPRRLSQLGPGVAWIDADADGWDDLAIGSGRGGAMGIFLNDRQGGFSPQKNEKFNVGRDQAGLAAFPTERPLLLVGVASYEDNSKSAAAQPWVQAWDLVKGEVAWELPGGESSCGPLSAADYDGDGQLEVFVGGRVIGGRYPMPATSRLYRIVNGRLAEDLGAAKLLAGVGLVSGAVWCDLDADGYPELVLACEWGSLRVFAFGPTKQWREITEGLGLTRFVGWWNGVAAGDFDNDGRMDLAASNWGRNHKYQTYRAHPLSIFYGEFSGGAGLDVLEAYYEPAMRKVVPWQHLGRVGDALPFVMAKFPTFRSFGEAGVKEILGDHYPRARELQATWLETTVFLNRGNHFEARILPLEAQLTPAFAICVADFDNDSAEDLFLSQNFFANEPETARYDAGRGLLLRGDGRGNFTPVLARDSGIRVYGEQRGAAVSDYDQDGRVDLCISQNGGETRLFRNVRSAPGVRLVLKGPPGNPKGIGAQISLPGGSAKELHAGSGYWSQDSLAITLPPLKAEAELRIRWPGGKVSRLSVSPADRQLTAPFPGP